MINLNVLEKYHMINFYKYHQGELDNRDLYADLLVDAPILVTRPNIDVDPILHIIKKSPRYAYRYAKYRLQNGRWVEAEPYIMKDPQYAHYYAYNILKSRWVEAEKNIMKNEYWWELYRGEFLR